MSTSAVGITLDAVLAALSEASKAYEIYEQKRAALIATINVHAATLKEAPPPGPPPSPKQFETP